MQIKANPAFLGLRIVPEERPSTLPAPDFAFRELENPMLRVSSDGSVHLFWSEMPCASRSTFQHFLGKRVPADPLHVVSVGRTDVDGADTETNYALTCRQ
jgi:hypothetical protein